VFQPRPERDIPKDVDERLQRDVDAESLGLHPITTPFSRASARLNVAASPIVAVGAAEGNRRQDAGRPVGEAHGRYSSRGTPAR